MQSHNKIYNLLLLFLTMKKILHSPASYLVHAIVSLLFVFTSPAMAQTAADYTQAMKMANIVIPFDVTAPGKEYKVAWGMDTAWDWDFNVNRGIAHIGVGNFGYGRISFQPTDLVTDNGDDTYSLSARQLAALESRIAHIKSTGVTDVLLNSDIPEEDMDTHKKNYKNTSWGQTSNKTEEYIKLFKATITKARDLGVNVVAIAPLNEPDYSANNQGKNSDFLNIVKAMRGEKFFDGIRICGPNTLNCKEAVNWYGYYSGYPRTYLKDYLDEGNTHQLAGSFDYYASFFTTVKADGKIATADELHNVGEAIVGVEYGMEKGIWWAFDAKARGQFCIDSNEGVRIGYGENRDAWTSGAVYRNEKTGEVHGYFGSSERQAKASTIQYVSTTKDVYFNGYGPTRSFIYNIPGYVSEYGSNDYQNGQINAERLFDITWGEDVAPSEINGTYRIVNAYSTRMMTYTGVGGTAFVQSNTYSSSTTQHWNVYPVYVDAKGEVKTDNNNKYVSYGDGVNGDVSYWFIDNAGNTDGHLNVLNNNLNAGAGLICFNAGHGDNEQWYLKYAKDGYYYIISRLTNKYLHCSEKTTGTNITLQNAPEAGISETNLSKYLWRFQPTDSKYETDAPAAPTDLQARRRAGSIQLTWTAPVDNDPLTYIVLREENGEWNTIGRNVSATTFVDNSVVQGVEYSYKVRAVDYAGNRSKESEILSAQALQEEALLCQLQFDNNTNDNTQNVFNASLYGTAGYTDTNKSGTAALDLTNGDSYLQLPYALAHNQSMTIATWVNWKGDKTWQRLFDFGNGTNSYMFLTPSNGSEMRFVMNNGSGEEVLSTSVLVENEWHHIAVTISSEGNGNTTATLYVDGEATATKADFTINPAVIAPSIAYVGRSMFPVDPLFTGYIDDFRVYNYALTEEEVKEIIGDLDEQSKDVTDEYEDTHVNVEITEAGYATFSSEYPLDLGNIKEGTAYIITEKANGDYISLEECSQVVAAKTGLIVTVDGDNAGTVTIPVATTEGDDLTETNFLVATGGEGETVPEGNYVFAWKNKEKSTVGMYILNKPTLVEGGKAYLNGEAVAANNVKVLRFVFDDNTPTAIVSTREESETEGILYNVAGQQVDKDYKGIVIDKNGNKYFRK